ncbi:MAG: putative quinol monooxygenase [Fusobacteria bacterium]|nr:putative quinol monooxygenase [Fusobacteriota bacterium]
MVFVSVSFKILPEFRAEFINYVEDKIKLVQKEEGCVKYILVEDTFENNSFIIYQKWINIESLGAHKAMPYMDEYIAKLQKWGVNSAQFDFFQQ